MRLMTRGAVPVLAAVAVAVVVALVALVVGAPFSDEPAGPGLAVAAADDDPEPPSDDRKATERQGHGPPPWAHGPKDKARKGWHEAWRRMTPREREETMTRLAEEHAAGMRAWARCKADGGDDCTKPMPPGLAKKQLRG